MGRKTCGLYINPRKFGTLLKPCMKEMMALLNCLAARGNNDDKCSGVGRKPWGSINYHLHRLSRAKEYLQTFG
ncbi:hypothetical protein MKW98_005782 [Papaver atlanticum]|uniref:Uncharacterized protein n=1 Tax=Papaver atlanticum TaxID=357466 RepID=A0AAD4XZH0_9MAGN|nr:hypothetical protein MKW98_005782 [Papaver atlanticum]